MCFKNAYNNGRKIRDFDHCLLFKLSTRNMKKSFKDYSIYFLTIVLGVAIFYMFNSIDSGQAMLDISSSTRQIIQLMVSMLGVVSVFVAAVLGLLIVYANNFLISRRKKEFGIYMTLGMGKRQISKIILLETVFVGIISLIVGLVLGIFALQFMSILVGKLFQANMSNFEFVFSQDACTKTCIYFAVMYVLVMFFNTFTISRYKLINLLTAIKKNEKVKIKNPIACIVIFLIAVVMLAYCYYKVTMKVNEISTFEKMMPIILMGAVSTVLIFWSMSGFILRLVQTRKQTYLKGTNMFVLRQLHNKINTTVVSMSVICLMLFMTITILSTAISLRNTMESDLKEMTPVDLNLEKQANLPESYVSKETGEMIYLPEIQQKDSMQDIEQTLIQNGLDMNILKDTIQLSIYTVDDITIKSTLGNAYVTAKQEYPFMNFETTEEIIKVSDYNKIAKLYGIDEYDLNDNEYIILCNFDNVAKIRNKALQERNNISINGKVYVPKYDKCQDGFIEMSTSHTNTGIILVPDNCNLKDEQINKWFLAANYNAKTDEEKEEIEKIFASSDSGLIQNLHDNGIEIDGQTKISITQGSVGIVTIVLFIAIYLGVIFLIASSAILALKQLTESSDNKQRYIILRKIGCDEKMINEALFRQIGIFFLMPLILAIVHSFFGIQFGIEVMSVLASKSELIPSAIVTLILIGVVYGLYFVATYFGSKNIIKEE